MTVLLWFRRDLRLHDHPALHAACAAGQDVLPVFCLDERLLRGRHASGPRAQFLLESLAELDTGLHAAGSRLIVRIGRPEDVLPLIVRATGAAQVHVTRDLTPFARRRGRGVAAALDGCGAEVVAHPGVSVVEDATALHTTTGTPYSVFTPFYRKWQHAPRRRPLPEPRGLPPCPDGVASDPLPSLDELGLHQEVSAPQRGGQSAGLARMDWFLSGPIEEYVHNHDALAVDGTSKLGAYLHLGCISPRALEAALPTGAAAVAGSEAFRRQLCWRDFYHHVLYHRPGNARQEYQERYRGTLSWARGSREERLFAAWAAGTTGFPLVDAAMRQLRREGWMHNRARMLAGSFLTKQFGVDWRRGEAHFMHLLLDGDEADNNGNWQWAASVGVDPQPVYRRLYNPSRHQQRYDPDGRYVRTYVPELREVPDRYLAEPWTMPDDVQRAAGCIIGTDYPKPVVDLSEARAQALDRYASAGARR